MIITDNDNSIILTSSSNPFGLRVKAYDKNGDMVKGVVEVDLVSLKAKQVVFDTNGVAQFNVNGDLLFQDIEVDLITIEHPSGSDSLMSRRVVNVGLC